MVSRSIVDRIQFRIGAEMDKGEFLKVKKQLKDLMSPEGKREYQDRIRNLQQFRGRQGEIDKAYAKKVSKLQEQVGMRETRTITERQRAGNKILETKKTQIKIGNEYADITKTQTQRQARFRYELLSTMFAGMALSRVFQGVNNRALEMGGGVGYLNTMMSLAAFDYLQPFNDMLMVMGDIIGDNPQLFGWIPVWTQFTGEMMSAVSQFGLFMDGLDGLKDMAKEGGVLEKVFSFFGKIKDRITKIADRIKDKVIKQLTNFKNSDAWESIKDHWDTMKSKVKEVASSIGSLATKFSTTMAEAGEYVLKGVNKIKGYFDKLPTAVKVAVVVSLTLAIMEAVRRGFEAITALPGVPEPAKRAIRTLLAAGGGVVAGIPAGPVGMAGAGMAAGATQAYFELTGQSPWAIGGPYLPSRERMNWLIEQQRREGFMPEESRIGLPAPSSGNVTINAPINVTVDNMSSNVDIDRLANQVSQKLGGEFERLSWG